MAAQRRSRDWGHVGGRKEVRPDLFITDRRHLVRQTAKWRGLTVCDLIGRPALLGLYLRGQDDYRIWLDPDGRFTFNLGKAYSFWAAARDLLPAAWR